HFTVVALELTPSDQFRPQTEQRRIRLRQLFGRMHGLGGVLTQLFVLGAALEVFALVSPLLMQLVLDHVVVGGDRDLLVVLCMGFLLLMLIRVGVDALRSWVALYLDTTLNLHLLTRLFTHLVRLPMPYF